MLGIKLKQQAASNPEQPLSIAIVGGGAGGSRVSFEYADLSEEKFYRTRIL